MATFTWNTGSGLFNAPTSWTPSGPPGTGDTALFNANSGTVSGTGSVDTLNLSAGGPWTFTGQVSANFFFVNDATTVSGPGVWTLTGSAPNGNYIIVANGANASGNLTVSGGGKIASTQAANTNSFSLLVGGGATATGANGTLSVTGVGSSVDMGSNGAGVGETGTGTLTVSAGATAAFRTTNSNAISALGVGRAGNGTVNVTGAGSQVTAGGYVYVGRRGTGTLNVDQSATFTGGSAASGGTSSFGITIGDGSPTLDANGNPNNPLYFGGTGTANVANGATLHSLGSLRVGYRGSTGNLVVDTSGTATADGQIIVGGGTDRPGAVGNVTVKGGGTLNSAGPHTQGSASVILGNDTGTTGTVTVTGSGSVLNTGGDRLTIGRLGTGTLAITAGGKVLAGASYTDTESALAVASLTSSTGTLTIDGAGSQLIASGPAVIGGVNSGSGITQGGTGTVTLTNGALLQTGAMNIEAGSTVTTDASSTLNVPSVTLDGGTLDLPTLSAASPPVTFGIDGTLRLHGITGTNTLNGLTIGDRIDLAQGVSFTFANNTVTTSTGSIALNPAPTASSYQQVSDGRGGTYIALTPNTVGVYRFFDKVYGTHFFTTSASEKTGLITAGSSTYRPDLVQETNGFGAIDPSAPDPNKVTLYRFFDKVYGTHFLTASQAEANGLMDSKSSTYRPDLVFESGSNFAEHSSQQLGDVAVYRFFDSIKGTHFYTGDQNEYRSITTAGSSGYRPDLVSEGVGFYAPTGTYT